MVELLFDVHLQTGSYFFPYLPFASIPHSGEVQKFG